MREAFQRLAAAAVEDESARVLREQGELKAAVKSYRDGLAIREKLAAASPDNAETRWSLFSSHWRLGRYADDPVDQFGKAFAVLEELHAEGRLAPAKVEWIGKAKDRLAEAKKAARVKPRTKGRGRPKAKAKAAG